MTVSPHNYDYFPVGVIINLVPTRTLIIHLFLLCIPISVHKMIHLKVSFETENNSDKSPESWEQFAEL